MNIGTYLKKLLVNSSVYYTVITVFYVVIMWVVNLEDDTFLLPASRLLLNFIFSFLAAAAWGLYRMPRLPSAARLLLHYGILTLAFYLCFLFPAFMNGAQVFIGIVVFTALYFAIMGIGALFLARFRVNAEQASPYSEQYKKRS